jgi:hypothetical protein
MRGEGGDEGGSGGEWGWWRESAALSIGSRGRFEVPSEAERACKH